MSKTKAKEALRIAEELARKVKSSVDFHNAFFGVGGQFGQLFPTRAEREAFAKKAEYRQILRLRESLADTENVTS